MNAHAESTEGEDVRSNMLCVRFNRLAPVVIEYNPNPLHSRRYVAAIVLIAPVPTVSATVGYICITGLLSRLKEAHLS